MTKILNKAGEELNLLKFKLIKGEIPEDIVPIIVSKYSKDIQSLLNNDKLTLLDFTEKLKEMPKYCLTTKEVEDLTKTTIVDMYDRELAKTTEKYTVRIAKNTLIVEKFIRISQQYYKNLLGIDLTDLRNKAEVSKKRGSYGYGSFSSKDKETIAEKNYKNEVNHFKHFTQNRLRVVLDTLKNSVFENKVIPMYKTIKTEGLRPLRIVTKIEDNVGTIGLYIDLDTKGDFDKNIKVINNFLNLINTEIEQQMNYNMYK